MTDQTTGTVKKTVIIAVPGHVAWDAISDVGQLHVRVAPGMVVDTKMLDDGAVRVVTFANGAVLTEHIISNDPVARRLAWTASGGPWTHHNAALEIDDHAQGCAVTWTADVLPRDAGLIVEQFIDAGLATFKAHLEANANA